MKQTIVDTNDEVIGYRERGSLEPWDIYRVAALWVTNSEWEILISQRAFSKKNHPGRWSCAAAGTVEYGESYEENIYKETLEEIGLDGYSLQYLWKEYRKWEKNDYFCERYTLECNQPIEYFTLQEEEVADLRWVKADDLRTEILHSPQFFLSSLQEWAKWEGVLFWGEK